MLKKRIIILCIVFIMFITASIAYNRLNVFPKLEITCAGQSVKYIGNYEFKRLDRTQSWYKDYGESWIDTERMFFERFYDYGNIEYFEPGEKVFFDFNIKPKKIRLGIWEKNVDGKTESYGYGSEKNLQADYFVLPEESGKYTYYIDVSWQDEELGWDVRPVLTGFGEYCFTVGVK